MALKFLIDILSGNLVLVNVVNAAIIARLTQAGDYRIDMAGNYRIAQDQ